MRTRQKPLIDAAEFAKAVADAGLGFATIDELVRIADEAGVWTDEMFTRGIAEAKKDVVRRLMRSKTKDEDGNVIEWCSVVRKNRKGETVQAYKQIAMFDVSDYVQVINDRYERRQYWDAEFRRYAMLAISRFGRTRIQKQFTFMLPTDDPELRDAASAN